MHVIHITRAISRACSISYISWCISPRKSTYIRINQIFTYSKSLILDLPWWIWTPAVLSIVDWCCSWESTRRVQADVAWDRTSRMDFRSKSLDIPGLRKVRWALWLHAVLGWVSYFSVPRAVPLPGSGVSPSGWEITCSHSRSMALSVWTSSK